MNNESSKSRTMGEIYIVKGKGNGKMEHKKKRTSAADHSDSNEKTRAHAFFFLPPDQSTSLHTEKLWYGCIGWML
jgi:hypothetical protein